MLRPLQDLVGQLYQHTPFHRPKQALLVQQNEECADNISFVSQLLHRRGYRTKVVGVEECTRERVLSSIDELAQSGRSNSRTFFYYAGRGHHIGKDYANGITVNGTDVDSQRIVPYALFKRLRNVKGKKAVVIDACLSGEFSEYLESQHQDKLLTDYVLIASTTKDGLSINTSWSSPKDSPLKDRIVSSVVYWLYTNGNTHKRINLAGIPIPTFKFLEGYPQELQKIHPGINVEKINLQIQRVSDTNFIL